VKKLFKLLVSRATEFLAKKCPNECRFIQAVVCTRKMETWWECIDCKSVIDSKIINKMGIKHQPFKFKDKNDE